MTFYFIAIPLPKDLYGLIHSIQTDLDGTVWTPDFNLHITLRTIGEISQGTIDDVDAVLSQKKFPELSLSLSSTGMFGTGKSKGPENWSGIWAGIKETDLLKKIKADIDNSLEKIDLPIQRHDSYLPHVTIGECLNTPSNQLSKYLANHHGFSSKAFQVEWLGLYDSPSIKGVPYTLVRKYPMVLSD